MPEQNQSMRETIDLSPASFDARNPSGRNRRGRRAGGWIALMAIVLVLAGGAAFALTMRDRAMEQADALDFARAAATFQSIPFGGKLFPRESDYARACAYAADGNYAQARKEFTALGTYRESATAAKETQYRQAQDALAMGETLQAAELYAGVSGYRDAKDKANEAYVLRADALLRSGNYDSAKETLKALIDAGYAPAEEKLLEVCKTHAAVLAEDGDFGAAYRELKEYEGTGKADGLLRMYRGNAFDLGVKAYRSGDNRTAFEQLGAVGAYENAADYLTLLAVRTTTDWTAASAAKAAASLKPLATMEDAGKLLVSSQLLGEQFLAGIWEGDGRFLSMNAAGSIDYDMPDFEYGDYYRLENGRILLYPDADCSDTKPLFGILVVTADCIQVYAYASGETFTLIRD